MMKLRPMVWLHSSASASCGLPVQQCICMHICVYMRGRHMCTREMEFLRGHQSSLGVFSMPYFSSVL